MKITMIALAALLVLCTADRKANTAKPASEKKVGARTEVAPLVPPDSESITLVPFEERLVVQAGHQLVVLAGSHASRVRLPEALSCCPRRLTLFNSFPYVGLTEV